MNSSPTAEIKMAIPWTTTSAMRFVELYDADSAHVHNTVAEYEEIPSIQLSKWFHLISPNL